MSYSSFSVGTSRNPAIVVARVPVRRSSGRTVEQMRADENAARRLARGASFATARSLVAAPMGIPLYAGKRGMMSRGEVKFFDCRVTEPTLAGPTYGLYPTTAPPTSSEPAVAFSGITCLNEVLQGATSYNRIGAKILIKSIDLRLALFLGGSAPTYGLARVCLIHDKQPNGAYPSFSDIFTDNISTAPDFNSGLNMSNKDRFVVLRNMVFPLDIGGNRSVAVKEHVKCKIETMYKANAGNIGDITSGAIYLVAFANATASAQFIQLTEIQSRIRYFD